MYCGVKKTTINEKSQKTFFHNYLIEYLSSGKQGIWSSPNELGHRGFLEKTSEEIRIIGK